MTPFANLLVSTCLLLGFITSPVKADEAMMRSLTDSHVCELSTFGQTSNDSWTVLPRYTQFVTEAKRRGLKCGVSGKPPQSVAPTKLGDAPTIVRMPKDTQMEHFYIGTFRKCEKGRTANTQQNVIEQLKCFERSILRWLSTVPDWRQKRANGADITTAISEPVFVSERLRNLVAVGNLSPSYARYEFVEKLKIHHGIFDVLEQRYTAKAERERRQQFDGILKALIGFGIASGDIPISNGGGALVPSTPLFKEQKKLVRQYSDGVNRMCTYCCQNGYEFTVTFRANEMCPSTQ